MLKVLASIIGCTALCVAQSAAAVSWQMATGYPDSSFQTQNTYWFAKAVEEATHGEVKISVHSNATLVTIPEMKRALRTGQVQIGDMFISVYGNEYKVFEMDSLPFLLSGVDGAKRIYEAQKPYIEAKLLKEGIKPLYSVIWPGNGLYTNVEINKIEDLRDTKLRGQTPLVALFAKLSGASPVNIQFAEVPQAFSTGVVNGMFSAGSNAQVAQMWDYTKYFYDLKAYYPRDLVGVNLSAWKKLSSENQAAIEKVAAEAEKLGWDTAIKLEEESLVVMRKHGMKAGAPDPELAAQFQAIGDRLTEDWLKNADPDSKAIVAKLRQAEK